MTPPGAELAPESITARSKSSFLAGFACMGEERRAAMTAIYAFCRVVDDAVDEAPDAATGRGRLAFWRSELEAAYGAAPTTPVGRALQRAAQRFEVPCAPLSDLLDGCATDLVPDGIADERALLEYCYRVASAVGLACLPVFGATSTGAQRFAVALGRALQLTNILRDLRGDAEVGRTYAPRTWLAECGVDAKWLLGTGPDPVYAPGGPVAQLCQRLVARGEEHFAAARRELQQLAVRERRRLVPARIMGAIYGDLLRRLRRRGGDLRAPRARVPKSRRLVLALSVMVGVKA
ncbi:MAG: squalene/phytoene synthase family protein [Planctomycetes bacterium]|nr:squalene/phytoene synthase family protein [Planctomycetota bacterium]